MTELTEQLGRKSAVLDSLEKAVEVAHHEILLLKYSEQEKDRQIAAMHKARAFTTPSGKNVPTRSEDAGAGGATNSGQP